MGFADRCFQPASSDQRNLLRIATSLAHHSRGFYLRSADRFQKNLHAAATVQLSDLSHVIPQISRAEDARGVPDLGRY
jgi:hypothetical protein